MDKYTGAQLYIVPFTESFNEVRLTVYGTHYMRWQQLLIVAYSITTHKSQSMTAHNGIVYDKSRATDFDKVALSSLI